MGNDFNFSNVEQQVLAEELWLDGNTHIDTGIKLFGSGEKSFTLAIDFEYYDTSLTDATILSCFEEDGTEGFRLRYNSYPQIQWGDKTQRIGYGSERGMVVIRHTAGTNTITVYAFDIGDNDNCYTDTMTITELTRSRTTNTEATIVLGAIKFLADGGYDYHTEGWIHWAKLWYADLGDDVAKQLASWNRETWRFEFIDAQRYRLSGNTSAKSNASFICNHYLSKLHKMNNSSTNVGGWDASLMHTFFKNRIYNAFPTKWKSVMKKVKIPASIGNKSTDIVNSEDFVYLPSSIEMSATSYTGAPYNNEGITIPWYTTDNARLKFRGYIVPDGVNFYNTSDDPTSVSGNSVNDGDVWIKGNSRYRYISSQNSKHKDFAQSDHLSASDGGLWFASRNGWTRSAIVGNTTNFIYVGSTGGMTSNSASYSLSVCPCFSI